MTHTRCKGEFYKGKKAQAKAVKKEQLAFSVIRGLEHTAVAAAAATRRLTVEPIE
jgi:precorrin-4 methylase